ncbi:MAG: phosphate ABC transporter ATP-binding protein [Holophagales bacterium]|nr:phosphate ABC transporter ATP-binding protein [Holophagales bacterium]
MSTKRTDPPATGQTHGRTPGTEHDLATRHRKSRFPRFETVPGTDGTVLCGPGCDCTEPEAGPRLRVRQLDCFYGRAAALRGVELDIPAEQITALIGPSGCGKTSFLCTLNRMTDLIPGCRVQGRVELDGENVLDPAADVVALRRRVGMIFQKPNPFPLSIRRNLELPLREHGVKHRHERQGRMETVLRDVGLWAEVKDRLDAPALALSGGQQQRLCLARALALEPEVVLFDEPCSALDPLSSGVVEDLIASLRGRYTVVIVTHNLAQARRIADRTAFFWLVDGAGRLLESGPTDRIFGAPRNPLTRAYVEGVRG